MALWLGGTGAVQRAPSPGDRAWGVCPRSVQTSHTRGITARTKSFRTRRPVPARLRGGQSVRPPHRPSHRDDCKNDGRAQHEPRYRCNLREVGCFDSHLPPFQSCRTQELLVERVPLTGVPVRRAETFSQKAPAPKDTTIPCRGVARLRLLIKGAKGIHHVIKSDWLVAARRIP
jgi:hypothetical protein